MYVLIDCCYINHLLISNNHNNNISNNKKEKIKKWRKETYVDNVGRIMLLLTDGGDYNA